MVLIVLACFQVFTLCRQAQSNPRGTTKQTKDNREKAVTSPVAMLTQQCRFNEGIGVLATTRVFTSNI